MAQQHPVAALPHQWNVILWCYYEKPEPGQADELKELFYHGAVSTQRNMTAQDNIQA